MDSEYYVLTPEKRARALDVVGTDVSILATASSNGAFGATFQQGAADTGPPPHSHDWDEAFYVISGTVNFQCGGEHHVCPAGTFVHVPRNTVHAFSYAEGGGSMLEITSRDSTATELFTAFDAEIDQNSDRTAAVDVLQRNGVTVAG